MSTTIIAEPELAAEPAVEQEWIFTFGHGQRAHSHGSRVGHDLEAEGFPLHNRYVRIAGTYEAARAEMVRMFGPVWSMQYQSEAEAGVEEYRLTELVITGRDRER